MISSKICILLATHNGERYLGQQLDCLVRQTEVDWIALIRDDASSDRTREILEAACQNESRFMLVEGNTSLTPEGAISNFSHLLALGEKTTAEYFFLCDQDDWWRETKLEAMVSAMGRNSGPVLCYCRYQLVDRSLNEVGSVNTPALPKYHPELADLLSLNSIPGCTMGFDRKLLSLALPLPDSVIMHDWWLALVASCFADLLRCEEPLTLYRQHDSNAVGVFSILGLMASFWSVPKYWRNGDVELLKTFQQAAVLSARGSDVAELAQDKKKILREYASLLSLSRIERLSLAKRLDLRKRDILARMVLYARLLLMKTPS